MEVSKFSQKFVFSIKGISLLSNNLNDVLSILLQFPQLHFSLIKKGCLCIHNFIMSIDFLLSILILKVQRTSMLVN